MSGSSLVERPIVRFLEEALGDEAGPFLHLLREAAIASVTEAGRAIRKRLGEDCPLSGVKVMAHEDALRGVLDLSETAFWMMGSITVRGTALSETAMMAARGGPLGRVMEHRWLDESLVAADVRRSKTTSIVDVGKETMALADVRGWPPGL